MKLSLCLLDEAACLSRAEAVAIKAAVGQVTSGGGSRAKWVLETHVKSGGGVNEQKRELADRMKQQEPVRTD